MDCLLCWRDWLENGEDRTVNIFTVSFFGHRIIGLLEAEEISKMDLIVNRIRMDMVRRGDMMSMEDVTDILGIPILGAIPDDEEIVISTNQGEPLVGMNSFAGQAYLNICKRILGQEVPLMGLEKNKGFFHMFSGLLKRA